MAIWRENGDGTVVTPSHPGTFVKIRNSSLSLPTTVRLFDSSERQLVQRALRTLRANKLLLVTPSPLLQFSSIQFHGHQNMVFCLCSFLSTWKVISSQSASTCLRPWQATVARLSQRCLEPVQRAGTPGTHLLQEIRLPPSAGRILTSSPPTFNTMTRDCRDSAILWKRKPNAQRIPASHLSRSQGAQECPLEHATTETCK